MNRINTPGGLPIDPRIGRTAPVGKSSQQPPVQKSGTAPFSEILQKELKKGQEIRFSAHAQDRLNSRGIKLSPEVMDKLTQAVDKAAVKGARDALVLMPGSSRTDDLALVVSVTNRTVVTAMDGENIRENVFTNIDSALVVH
jgi:flagellar operon protein